VEAVTWLLEMNATRKRALLQLTNELAVVNCGTPFLIQSAHEKPDLYRNCKSLKMASKIVAAQDGLLVIVIDAADNAMCC